MIAPFSKTEIISFLHESYGAYRIVERISRPLRESPELDASPTLAAFLRSRSVKSNDISRVIAGDVSIFDSPLSNSELRVSSVPVLHDERSLSLTCIRANAGCDFVPPTPPAQFVLSQLLAKSQAAVCVIDPANELVTSYNRSFAELWRLNVDTQLAWHGLPLASLQLNASTLARSRVDVHDFFSQTNLNESVTRVLGLEDSDAIEGTFEPVWLDSAAPYRVIAKFSRLGLAAALRRKELAQTFAKLTGRQKEVLQHVTAGRTNAEIAQQLGIVVKTVEKHRSMAIARLGVDSVPELVRLMDVIN